MLNTVQHLYARFLQDFLHFFADGEQKIFYKAVAHAACNPIQLDNGTTVHVFRKLCKKHVVYISEIRPSFKYLTAVQFFHKKPVHQRPVGIPALVPLALRLPPYRPLVQFASDLLKNLFQLLPVNRLQKIIFHIIFHHAFCILKSLMSADHDEFDVPIDLPHLFDQ